MPSLYYSSDLTNEKLIKIIERRTLWFGVLKIILAILLLGITIGIMYLINHNLI